MRRFLSLTSVLAVTLLSLGAFPLHAQTSCSCPWQVEQLTTTTSSCQLAEQNNQQNAGFWADNACVNQGGACTYAYTFLSCDTNPDGSATATGLINYKCNQC